MAERRMFAKTIIDSDEFLDMPVTARLLYYDLAMRADDDGFVNSPKKIMKFVGASPDDMSILIMRKFVIPFDSGVVVIRHWRIHNYIRKDTYSETPYKTEKAELSLDENNAYVKTDEAYLVHDPSTARPRLVNEPSTQDRIGKDSKGKDRVKSVSVESSEESSTPPDTDEIICALILNDSTLYHLTESMAEQYEKLYPAVDVRQEFRNMAGWCDVNPMKRKTRGGAKRFVVNWLAREQNRGRSVPVQNQNQGFVPPPDDYPF